MVVEAEMVVVAEMVMVVVVGEMVMVGREMVMVEKEVVMVVVVEEMVMVVVTVDLVLLQYRIPRQVLDGFRSDTPGANGNSIRPPPTPSSGTCSTQRKSTAHNMRWNRSL